MNSPSNSDSWLGRTLGDRQRYRLEKRLGKGGMGDVFLATDTLLGKQVALKLIKDALARSEELRKRFEREVSVCAALKSNHIVEVNDYGVTPEGYPFFVMEYLQGQTLGQLLRQEKRLTVERTVSIVSQVCQGLRLAHAGVILWRDGAAVSGKISVIHRDLKPDNIFLVSTTLGELVKVLDFGVAKIYDDQAKLTNLTRTFLGTFRYASPEQLGVAKDLDGRADIYSLGMILYEMLSGTDPFGLGRVGGSTTEVAWARAHSSKPPLPLRSHPGLEHLSLEIEEVVMRCLRKPPGDRYASVDELSRALQSALSGMNNSSQTSTLSRQGSNDSTINRPPVSKQQVPDTTIFQPPPLESQDPGNDTVERPLAQLAQQVPDATIFQPPPAATNSHDSTINRPLAAEPQAPDSTIFQPPPAAANLNDNRVNTPRVPDSTIFQPKPPVPLNSNDNRVNTPRVPDSTIFQPPPATANSNDPQVDTPPSRQRVPDASIPQIQESSLNLTQLLKPLGVGFAIGLAVIGGIYAYFQLQPRKASVVDEIQNLKTQGKYEDCVTKAETVGQEDSNLYANAQSLLNDCQLEHAKQLAAGKNFTGAITAAKKIPENSPFHQEAQALIEQWSKPVDNSI